MRMLTFAKRNFKEIIRDPINLGFLFGFPIVLLLLLSAIQVNIPVSMFEIEHLAPGIVVFGLAFMTLFSATLIAMGINGTVYPIIKSCGFIGVVYKRCIKLLCLSFAIKVAENKVINASPNTTIPGARCSISNILTGILA